MVFESIAGGLVKAALPKVAGAIATAVKDKLHPTELQRALEVGLRKSGTFDQGQKANNVVFYRWEPGKTDKFLAMLLEHPEVQRELQKPLEQDGAPDVAILVQVAQHIAADRTLPVQDDTLEPWLKTFANAYFDAITAIRFQVAKADYLEQLANWFDDVKFAGVAVPGQDVERAERLAQIFVMPDVEEDGGVRSRLAFERSFLEEQGEQGRQGELLQEQRLRAQLERSGRKFSARQLLNQHQKKVVLLGAPGSGKTTLMSFFAVTLAERQGAIAPASDAHAEGLTQERSPNPLQKGALEIPPFLRGARGDQDFKHQPRMVLDAEGIDHDAEGIDRHRSRMVPDAEGIDRDAEGIDRDRSQMDRHTEGIDRDRSQMQRDRLAMVPATEGLRLEPTGLQTDTDALPLPILIRIRDWARTPDVTIPEYARQFAETTMSCKPLPKGFFEHWLNNGRSLILLDGLDEVAEEAKRYHLVQCIENFLGQYPQNRAIITSRPAGYKRDFFRTEEFPHYELQPFDDGKIEEFCDRWYRSRIQDTAEALRRKESLQKALNQQDRIKLLARNPLLLTIIALIHRYQARLPRERYKLYDKAVETLLTSWDDNKELSNQTVLKYLQLDDLRRLMESLAYWIHTQGNTGDTEGGTLIDKDELIQKLCQEIKTLKQLKQYEAKEEAKRFVTFIRDRTGLLNEQGQDCYAFVHKTFQEYLAAQDINYQADNEDDFAIVLTHIEQHLHDPHWREVLLLLIAQQSPKKAARAIRKVLTANSPYEQWLHRDLFFAGRCLAEDPKGLNVVDAPLVAQLLEQLVALEISGSRLITDKVRSQMMQILCSLSETVYESQALSLLKDAAVQIDPDRLRKYQVELGDAEAAIAPLLALLQDADSIVRANATEALSRLGNASDVVLQGLLALLQDVDSDLRSRAAFALGNLGDTSNVVLQALLALLQDEAAWVRYRAAAALGKLGNASDVVLQGLLALLQDVDSDVRDRAAEVLGKLGNASDVVLQGLLALLQDVDSDLRSRAAFALGNLGNTSNVVLQALLALLQDEAAWVRYRAAEALGNLGNTSSVVLQALLALLQDEAANVRSRTAFALGNLGNTSDVVLQGLLALLQDEISNVRSIAAEALGKLGITSDVVVHRLLTLLQNAKSWESYRAAFALGNLGNTSDVVLQGLLVLLQNANPLVRGKAVLALGKLGKRSDQVEPAIVQWIEQHQDEEYVGAGIDALWEIVEGEG